MSFRVEKQNVFCYVLISVTGKLILFVVKGYAWISNSWFVTKTCLLIDRSVCFLNNGFQVLEHYYATVCNTY